MRAARVIWLKAGRPRGRENPLYCAYKDAKCIFRKKLRSVYADIERDFFKNVEHAAETDQSLFWALLKRNKQCRGRVSELIVDGNVYRTSEEITLKWADYFHKQYSPKATNNYDNEHKIFIENELKTLLMKSHENYKEILDGGISETEVKCAVKSLKLKKSTGFDCVANEHILYGGDVLINHLVTLFNLFMHYEHIPLEAKQGVIVTIPKSGKKQANLRESYRGITLLTSVYKLFETVLLNRIKVASEVFNLQLCHPSP